MKLIIEPGRAVKNYWRDLWQYRELMYFLAWRDIAVRYKQTIIGVAWVLIRPALTMLVFVAFRRLAGFPPGSVPEPILVAAAVLPWQFFSTALSELAGSVVGNGNLISKVYFPRIIIPLAATVTSFVDFLITLGLRPFGRFGIISRGPQRGIQRLPVCRTLRHPARVFRDADCI